MRGAAAAGRFARIHVHARAHEDEDGNARTLFFEVATQEADYIFLKYIKRLDLIHGSNKSENQKEKTNSTLPL